MRVIGNKLTVENVGKKIKEQWNLAATFRVEQIGFQFFMVTFRVYNILKLAT